MSIRLSLLVVAGLLVSGVAQSETSAEPAVATSLDKAKPGAASGADDGELCAPPADFPASNTDFPNFARALRDGGDVDVLAIGSASMLSPKNTADGSFPYRMAEAIHAAFPRANIRLTVHSGRGLTAADMLAPLTSQLAERHFSLVLWQTGTIEAVRNLPPDELFQTLDEGAKRVHEGGADLILVDPQYSRFLRANANLDPYLQVMQQAGSFADTYLLHRFDLMHHWVEDGRIDLERATRPEREATAARLHACLGKTLADAILVRIGTAGTGHPIQTP